MKKTIDDYDLIDEDFEEFLRRGKEAFGMNERTTEIERLRPKGESA